MHRFNFSGAPFTNRDFAYAAASGWKQTRVPGKQPFLGQWGGVVLRRIQHHLDHSFDVAAGSSGAPEFQPEPALYGTQGHEQQRERNTPRFGETLMLSAKQMDNALRRFASGIPAALALIEHGLCSKVSKKRYAELIKTRASQLDF